jgi:mono/diheme cytochrome c family protein
MHTRWSVFAAAGLLLLTGFAVSAQQTAQPKQSTGFNLPPNAADEKNPVAGDAKAVAAGKELFKKHCERCHGPGGKGDGPDADPDVQEDMDLTRAARAARNPDGVVFWKVNNGRARPKMPSFKDDMTKDQIWQVVTYVQTLRAK